MNSKGQTLIEVIVAAAVGTLVVAALTFATIFSLRNATLAKTSAQATKLAQEGIERVRTGRDRNVSITGNFQIGRSDITSWDDPDLWSNQISPSCIPGCYFKILDTGELQYKGTSILLLKTIESNFTRAVILSDDAGSYTTQKKVTVIVTWKDFAGDHESKLTTILRKL